MKDRRTNEPLTRAELAKTLGVGKSTIIRWEAKGTITGFVNERGVHLFRVEGEVAELIGDRPIIRLDQARVHVPSAATVGGDLAAMLYERFERNVHPIDIVRELGVHPDVLEGFVNRWRRWRKAVIMKPSVMMALAEVLGIRPTRNPEHFVEGARRAIARLTDSSKCRTCKERRARACGICQMEREERLDSRLRERFGLPPRKRAEPDASSGAGDEPPSEDDDGDDDDDDDDDDDE